MAVPATLKDPSTRRRWIIAALIIAVVAALAASAYFYFRVVRYQPTAHRHVPVGSNIVLRADAAKILAFKPVRKHIWPLLLESRGDSDSARRRRIKRIEEETGVGIPVDLREAIVASLDATSWVALVGGNIEAGRFVPGLHKVLKEEGLDGWRLSGELLVHDFGAAIGQADDGTLVLGTNVDVTQAALPERDKDAELPLPMEGALTFLVNQRAYSGAIDLLPLSLPGLDPLSDIKQLTGTVTLSEKPQVDLRITPKPKVKADALARDLDSTASKLRLALLLVPHDLFGGKAAINDATITAQGSEVRIAAPWPYEPLDEAIKSLAEALGGGTDERKTK